MAVAFVRSHTVTSEKVLDTSVGLAISTATTPGNVLVAFILSDNAGTTLKPVVSGITVPAGETATWARLGAARSVSTSIGAFSAGEMWAIRTTVAWPAATYTVTFDTAVTMKATIAQEFSGVLATMRSTSGGAYSETTATASASTTGTAPVVGDLALVSYFNSNSIATSFAFSGRVNTGTYGSTGGSAATNNTGVSYYQISTNTTHKTASSQGGVTAGNGAIVAVLQQYVDPAITLAAYRFYADGTETGSTALAAQDTTPTVDTSGGDVNAQVRVRLQATTSAAGDPWDDFQLQWEKNSSGTWAGVEAAAIVDAYSVAGNGTNAIYVGQDQSGQSFLGNGSNLVRAGFRVGRAGAPDGTVTVSLYSHTGTFGTSGLPGALLATSSTVVPCSTLTLTDTPDWVWFDFDGTYPLNSGTPYFIVLATTTTSTNIANAVKQRGQTTGGVHPGNRATLLTGAWTGGGVGADVIFEVDGPASTVVPYGSPNLTDGAATTNRLTGGSGTFTAGKISEDGLVDDVGWAGNNHTELLYSITLKAADLTAGDTIRFRVLRNGATTGLTYTQYPTVTIGGGGGPVDKPVAGTVAATSATSGAIARVPRDYPLAGLVAATTATAGTIGTSVPAQAYPLAGTVAATTATAGSIERQGQAYPLAGTVTATTSSSGDPTARHPLAGLLPASSTTAGAVTATHPLAGTVAGSSTTSGNPTAVHPIAGTTPATSTTAGTIGTVVGPVDYPLAGTLPATSTTSGALARLNLALAATVAAVGLVSGAPTALHPLAGTTAGSSTTVGSPATALPLTGAVAGATTTTGAITAVHPLDGTVTATTTSSGNPTAIHPLTGTNVPAVSTTNGTINLVGGPQVYPLAGLLPATSTTAGSIGTRPTLPVAGLLPATSTTAGNPTARHPLAGLLPATSTTAGSLGARQLLAGTVAGTSTATGTLGVVVGGRPKAYVAGSWQQKPGKIWTGTGWVEKPWKRWDGTTWKRIT